MNIQRNQWRMSRRTFLRAAGVSLSLPWLEAMGANSTSCPRPGDHARREIPRRAYFSNWGFFEAMAGVPKETGLDYTLTPTLSAMAPYKRDFTLISDLRAFSGGHYQQPCLLTGMDTPANGMKLVSVDQQIADFYEGQTRVPSLVLAHDRQPTLVLEPQQDADQSREQSQGRFRPALRRRKPRRRAPRGAARWTTPAAFSIA